MPGLHIDEVGNAEGALPAGNFEGTAEDLQLEIQAIEVPEIVDALNSIDINKALSANQGNSLFNMITVIQNIVSSNDVNLDTVQEIVTYIKEIEVTNITGLPSQLLSKQGFVNTIAELKNLDGTKNKTVEVLGYYTPGDGGGGSFYWDAASVEEDNGGTIIQATGVNNGRWKRNFSGAVNVKWFGAKGDFNISTGLGSDDTLVFQKAYDFISNKRGGHRQGWGIGELYCPKAAYLIEGTITFNSAVSIKISGDGPFATAFIFDNDTDVFFQLNIDINFKLQDLSIRHNNTLPMADCTNKCISRNTSGGGLLLNLERVVIDKFNTQIDQTEEVNGDTGLFIACDFIGANTHYYSRSGQDLGNKYIGCKFSNIKVVNDVRGRGQTEFDSCTFIVWNILNFDVLDDGRVGVASKYIFNNCTVEYREEYNSKILTCSGSDDAGNGLPLILFKNTGIFHNSGTPPTSTTFQVFSTVRLFFENSSVKNSTMSISTTNKEHGEIKTYVKFEDCTATIEPKDITYTGTKLMAMPVLYKNNNDVVDIIKKTDSCVWLPESTFSQTISGVQGKIKPTGTVERELFFDLKNAADFYINSATLIAKGGFGAVDTVIDVFTDQLKEDLVTTLTLPPIATGAFEFELPNSLIVSEGLYFVVRPSAASSQLKGYVKIDYSVDNNLPHVSVQRVKKEISDADVIHQNEIAERKEGALTIGGEFEAEGISNQRGIYSIENGLVRVINPKGGSLKGNNSETGAIKITLPVLWTDTMLKLSVDIFNYALQGSFTVKLGGYNVDGWHPNSTVAQTISSRDIRDYTVRYGHDGTNACIWIGEVDSVWGSPQVSVNNFVGGLNAVDSRWAKDWNVSFVQQFDTVQVIKENNFLYADANKLKNLTEVARNYKALTATEPTHAVNLEQVKRPIKIVNNSTQYTFVNGDEYKHLVFPGLASKFIIPDGVFAEADKLEGTFIGAESEIVSKLDVNSNPLITINAPKAANYSKGGKFEIKFTTINQVALSGDFKDSPPVQNSYTTLGDMYINQDKQTKGFAQYVTNIGHFEYLGTINGDASDYRIWGNSTGGTIDVTASRDLLPSDNGKTLLITGENIILTVPVGLGEDFACNFMLLDPDTGVCQIVAGVGFTLNAPLGDKLLVDYTASLTKKTGAEVGYLRGELTP